MNGETNGVRWRYLLHTGMNREDSSWETPAGAREHPIVLWTSAETYPKSVTIQTPLDQRLTMLRIMLSVLTPTEDELIRVAYAQPLQQVGDYTLFSADAAGAQQFLTRAEPALRELRSWVKHVRRMRGLEPFAILFWPRGTTMLFRSYVAEQGVVEAMAEVGAALAGS